MRDSSVVTTNPNPNPNSNPNPNPDPNQVRDSSVVTTDVAVEEIPALRPWLRKLLATRLCPMIEACYPRLADGSSLRDL